MLLFAGLMNTGQACVAQTRILAPRSRYDEIVEKVGAAVAQMKASACPTIRVRSSVR